MPNIYGIIDRGIYYDVSKSEKGAKAYATRHGFDKVACRVRCGYNPVIIAVKVGKKWKDTNE